MKVGIGMRQLIELLLYVMKFIMQHNWESTFLKDIHSTRTYLPYMKSIEWHEASNDLCFEDITQIKRYLPHGNYVLWVRKWGYRFIMCTSTSHVSLLTDMFLYNNFIKAAFLYLNPLTWWSMILTENF